jgi:hypothetical protein
MASLHPTNSMILFSSERGENVHDPSHQTVSVSALWLHLPVDWKLTSYMFYDIPLVYFLVIICFFKGYFHIEKHLPQFSEPIKSTYTHMDIVKFRLDFACLILCMNLCNTFYCIFTQIYKIWVIFLLSLVRNDLLF